MSWSCQELESRLNGYLEGRMAALELREADEHARSCPRCQVWAEARATRLLLAELGELDSPPGLETRILAHTLATPERVSLGAMLAEMGRAFLRPKMAMGTAAAMFCLFLLVSSFDIRLNEIELADLHPVNLYRALDQKVQLTYASSVRFFKELRVVYELRNQLEEWRGTSDESEEATPAPAEDDGDTPRQQSRPERLPRETQLVRTIASAHPSFMRTTP